MKEESASSKGSLLIRGANVYVPDRLLEAGAVHVLDGRIEAIYSAEDVIPGVVLEGEVWDAAGMLLVPGFVDVHVHGGGGADTMYAAYEDTAIDRMSRFHATHGTTSFLATTMTAERESLKRSLAGAAKAIRDGVGGAEVIGIHLEGPFLNPKRCGAQNPDLMRVMELEELDEFLDAADGQIRLITLAPERGDALERIGYLRERGVTVSIGHSDADAATVKRAVEAGATHVTHLFNGMSPLHHREPGVAGAALLHDELAVELICDGLHLHPDVVKLAFAMKPRDRVVLITDAIEAAGLPDGDYALGGLPVVVSGGKAVLRDGGNLAGSCLTMGQALKNAIAFTGLPLSEVLPALTLNPARQIGVDGRKGSIEAGKDADLVLLDTDYSVVRTYVKGVRVHG